MAKVYILIYFDYDLGVCIHSSHKTKEGAGRAKAAKEEAFGVIEQGSFFDVEEYELHD